MDFLKEIFKYKITSLLIFLVIYISYVILMCIFFKSSHKNDKEDDD